jgi:vitamin B12 transporter
MRRLLLASTLFLPALAAHAQDAGSATTTTLPEKVVTATRVPTLIDQVAAGVTVITRAEIEAHGYTSLAQALQTVPGLHVVQSGGDGGQASVFVRGADSNQVLVLRDGMPLNDPSDPSGAFNFGVGSLADVERIEIIRGPMSGLWGSGAIGGVINLITRRGSGAAHGTATIAGGLPRAGLVAATLSGASNGFDYSLAAESHSEIGFDTTPRRESVYTGHRNGYRSQLVSVNLGYTPFDGTRLFAFARYRTATFGLDELGNPAYDATDYTGRDRSFQGRLGVHSSLFDGAWETTLALGHLDTLRRYSEPLEGADPNATSGLSRYNGRRTEVQWNNTLHLPDWGMATENALTFAVDHQRDNSRSHLDMSYGGWPYVSTVGASARHTAGSLGLQSTLAGRLTLTGALREENATYGGDAFTWRAGGVLALPEVWSRLKLSYGTSFLAPSLYDLFGVDDYNYRGNPTLRPEKSEGGEVGLAVDLPLWDRRDGASVEVTLFENHIRDLIEVVYGPGFAWSTTTNVGRAFTHGVEASLSLHPARWADARFSWTYTVARDQSGAALLRRPRNQASASLQLRPLPALIIIPQIEYISGDRDYIVDDNGFDSGLGFTRSGLICNLSVDYTVAPRATLFVDARNIGNSRYEPASGYQMPGPSFLAGVRLGY